MTKSVICILAVLSVLSLSHNIALGDAKYRFVGEDVDQADIAELQNYRTDLAKAFARDSAALKSILRLSVHHIFDGAGALSYSGRVNRLLEQWGDHAFASVLSTESDDVKRAVIRMLDNYALHQFIQKYPETTSLGVHDAERK
jgi:hypothetical protein